MSDTPLVSVIMPIRNEEAFIERSLGAVLAQDYPHYEVLIADGMSTDRTRAIIAGLAEKTHVPVTIIDNPAGIVPTGWNKALAAAKGAIIVRVDGHTIIEPDYVRECVAALDRTGADNVGGRMNAVGTTAWGRAIAAATSSPFGVGSALFHYAETETEVDTVYMGAWRRDVFERIGGFDEAMVRNQDDEFNYRLRASGGKILLTPRIRSTYYNRGDLKKLWKQYFEYGYYKVLVLRKHPRQMSLRQFIPPLFVAGLVVGLPLALLNGILAILYLLAIGVYAALNAVFSLRIGMKNGGIGFASRLIATFAALHLAYGAGFWMGVLNQVKPEVKSNEG
jgi:glycosyltransferase involved in cell wall biosynthesis